MHLFLYEQEYIVDEQERVQLTPEWTPEELLERMNPNDLRSTQSVSDHQSIRELYDEGGTPDCPGTNYTLMALMSTMQV